VLVSHPYRFIYTKTLKTAGTSVEIYFEDACTSPESAVVRGHHVEETETSAGVIGYRGPDPSGRRWYNHMPASAIRKLLGHETWTNYYKFCVVRNPFDKLVSLWWFNNAKQGLRYDGDPFSMIKADFSRWCVDHASYAIDRDKYMIDGAVAMDCFIRYESLLQGLEQVCRQVGYPFRPGALGWYKNEARVTRQPFVDYYDPSAIAAVEANFAWELDYFGYGRLSQATAKAGISASVS
jgi:hypothetical protein